MKRTQIYLSEAQHELLRRIAFEQRKSISQVIRDIVDQFCKSPKNLGSVAPGRTAQESISVQTQKPKETKKDVKETIGKVLKSKEIDEVKEVAESLKGYVSEERYKQLTTAIEDYRKSLEELSKYS
jgi:hypothetical protein